MSSQFTGNTDDDDFGLPDVRLNPLSKPASTDTSAAPAAAPVNLPMSKPAPEPSKPADPVLPKSTSSTPASPPPAYEEPPKKSRTLIFILLPLILIGLGWIAYMIFLAGPSEEENKKAAESILKQNEKPKATQPLEAEKPQAVEPLVAGTTTLLDGPTSRFYIILHSSIDDDLIRDRCDVLNAQGVSCRVIPPFGRWKTYRLAIGDYASFDEAQTAADAQKATYGADIWVMKY